jgi:site-specific DNA-methyltransferase (adenine-specific)
MSNSIYFGDNLPILKTLPSESVDLIYIDPPFNTGKTQKRTTVRTVQDEDGDRKGFKGNTYRTIEIGTKAYEDTFESLIEFLRPRLFEAYRILSPQGSLYFHIDYREVHYCKILLDEIFGRECFLNEIIWAYDYGGRARTKWPAKHDNILFYVKNPKQYIFNAEEIDKEPYMAPGLVGIEKAKKGKMPTDTWWAAFTGTDKPSHPSDTWWMNYVDQFTPKGQNDNWWQTIVPTGSKERLGYPTQKPRKLIDRIVKASSLKGNTVLDFFAGSGTLGESCAELGRFFILIDNNPEALEVMAHRFAKAENIQWINFDPKPYQKIKKQDKDINKNFIEIPKLSQDFIMLAATANYLQNDLDKNLEDDIDLWKNSPFEWTLKLPPARKGKLGSDLITSWLSSKGMPVERTKDATKTIVINKHKVSLKFSTLWANGIYKFQQIRSFGYDYDFVICFGISPFAAHCWVFEKNYALKNATKQHKGGAESEYWISINPSQPQEWTKGFGGTLDEAYQILKKIK